MEALGGREKVTQRDPVVAYGLDCSEGEVGSSAGHTKGKEREGEDRETKVSERERE